MKEPLVLIGGGGHCKACVDVIEAQGAFSIAGIVDRTERVGQKVLGHRIFAVDTELPRLARKYKNFLITLGQIKTPERRKELFETLKSLKVRLPVIISPFSYVSGKSDIGEGTIILHGAHINAGARIGRNCIINTASIIEHDSMIEDHCHVSVAAIVNGGCSIGEGVFIGSGSVIANNLNIAKFSVIGASSVVVESLKKGGIYAGNPAKKLK